MTGRCSVAAQRVATEIAGLNDWGRTPEGRLTVVAEPVAPALQDATGCNAVRIPLPPRGFLSLTTLTFQKSERRFTPIPLRGFPPRRWAKGFDGLIPQGLRPRTPRMARPATASLEVQKPFSNWSSL